MLQYLKQQMTELQFALLINRMISAVGVEASIVHVIVVFIVTVLGVNRPTHFLISILTGHVLGIDFIVFKGAVLIFLQC